MDDAQKGQMMLVERLISCCKEVRFFFFFATLSAPSEHTHTPFPNV
jgi:hypothetical protein